MKKQITNQAISIQPVNIYAADHLIYPGTYVPVLNEDELQKEIKLSFKSEPDLAPVNMTELSDSYIIELSIPGVNREDFLIHSDENILTVCVCHKGCSQLSKNDFQKHTFNYGLLDQHIILPFNADAAFISAEYSLGTLRFHIPKNSQPVKNLHTRIVVY
jgi:HSP20 family protein